MGRVKIKRKSTLIDMTAMSDVTVLLLTFFMLTSTFLQKEPVTVKTPSSVSQLAVPASNLVTVLVDPEQHVFISITGAESMPSDTVRMEVLKRAVSTYNKLHKSNPVKLDEQQVKSFAALNMFGCPIAKLPEFLSLTPQEQDLALKPNAKDPNNYAGIPIDGRKEFQSNPNEFQIWMQAYQDVSQDIKCPVEKPDGTVDPDGTAYDLLRQGKVIALKADGTTPYSVVHLVMDNLQTMKMTRFTLMTSLKNE